MPSRRSFLTGTVATGVALSSQPFRTAIAQQKRTIVDSQVHLWPASTPQRPWLPAAKPQLPEPFTIERIIPLMDEAGVDRVVIVPPGSLEGERIDYAQEAVRRYPGRFAIMARIALDKPDRAARLTTWRDQVGVLGVRLNFVADEAAWLTDGTYPFRDTIPHIRRLFDAYGPQRCHWGTDVTNSFARATYRQRVTQFTEELPFLNESDKDWIMGRSLLERLRWT
ncbi:amidohydrolase family protein [Bradyrhizobium sp. USDA 4452]